MTRLFDPDRLEDILTEIGHKVVASGLTTEEASERLGCSTLTVQL